MKLLLVSNRLDFETVILNSCDDIQDFLFLRCIVGVVSHTKNYKRPSDGKRDKVCSWQSCDCLVAV